MVIQTISELAASRCERRGRADMSWQWNFRRKQVITVHLEAEAYGVVVVGVSRLHSDPHPVASMVADNSGVDDMRSFGMATLGNG